MLPSLPDQEITTMGFFASLNTSSSNTLDAIGTTSATLERLAKSAYVKAEGAVVSAELDSVEEVAERMTALGGAESAMQAVKDHKALIKRMRELE
jgi:hypothetical protein